MKDELLRDMRLGRLVELMYVETWGDFKAPSQIIEVTRRANHCLGCTETGPSNVLH